MAIVSYSMMKIKNLRHYFGVQIILIIHEHSCMVVICFWLFGKPLSLLDKAKSPPRSRLIRDLTRCLLILFFFSVLVPFIVEPLNYFNQSETRSYALPLAEIPSARPRSRPRALPFHVPHIQRGLERARCSRTNTEQLEPNKSFSKSLSRITPRVSPRFKEGGCTSVDYPEVWGMF